jgi:hypothetical protein
MLLIGIIVHASVLFMGVYHSLCDMEFRVKSVILRNCGRRRRNLKEGKRKVWNCSPSTIN